MTAAYARRRIVVTFQLGEGDFGLSGSSTVTLGGQLNSGAPGLRILAEIQNATLPSPGQAVVSIWGMKLSDINKLTQAGLQYKFRNNKIAVQAGDDQSGLTTVFNGVIIEAFPYFRNQPDTPFIVTAGPGPEISMPPVKPVTFPGSVPFETAVSQILQPTGYTLKNQGVNAVLASPYFQGTAMSQLMSAVRAADAYAAIDPVNRQIVTTPRTGGSANVSAVISPQNGMIGYPEFESLKVKVRSIFVPGVGKPGDYIQIQSQLSAANGVFFVTQTDYSLASELPDGPWEMLITATPPEDKAGGSATASG